MDDLGEDHDLQAVLDRNAFEGIENDGIDFCELEKYINEDASGTYFDDTLATSDVARAHAAVVAAAPGDDLGQPLAPPPQPDSNKTFVAGVYVIPSHGLPESPPDSGSEPPYSPQDHGGQSPHQRLSAGRAHTLQDILIHPMYPVHQPLSGPLSGPLAGPLVAGQHLVDLPPAGLSAGLPAGPTHTLHLQGAGGEMILVQHPVVPAGLPPAVASPPLAMHGDGQSVVYPGLAGGGGAVASSPVLPTKKRKLSQDGRIHVKTEPGMAEMSPDPSSNQTGALEEDYGLDCDNPYADSSMQCIRFSAFEPENWHVLIDGNLSELPAPKYQVVADKGFNFSNADDAFVCQKKNHFQITCHVRLHGDAQFVRAESSIQKILSWQLHFYGVKTEATAQTIKVEQSQSDRSKRAFHPVQVELRPDESVKKTVGRLHFSETTSNNMRKKGKPNPDQRYFYLVVGLHAHCADGNAYPVVAHNSERIIVRASNPGQFESDAELCWQKGSVSDSIYHTGKCGINTDRPEEALTVHGNLRITGHVIQPSDLRAKEAIQECDTRKQLRNVQQIRVVHYRYTDEFARHAGLPSSQNTGVIAQQVESILPEAVTSAGDVVLPNGARLDNFLVVNKERLFMENVGAVKELCKVTDNLETRIDELERMNRRLNLKRLERLDSLKSVSSSVSIRPSRSSKTGSFASFTDGILCSNKLIQSTIVILVLIIAFCLVAMATLYFLEFQKRNDNYDIPISRQTVIQTQTHPPALSTPRPSKMRYKSGATPYSKKLTTIAPSILKQQKADREGVKAERGDGGRAEKATAAPRPPPPPLPSGPPPPQHQQPPHPPVLGIPPLCDGEQAGCPTYCCQADPPPSAPVVRDADYNAVPTAPAPPPDPHSKATPPPYLATNALSSRPQREVLNNVDEDPGDQDKHAQQPTVTVTLLGANVNHTLGPGANPNNSYEVYLSRHLPDPELQLHVRFVRPWLKPEQCDSEPGQQCPRERGGAPWAKEDASGQPSGSPADGAAKQHLSRVGEAAVAPDARASVASADVHVIHVKIAYHVSYTVVFRVPWADNPNDVCTRTADGLGRDFLEYRIHFVRRCDL